MTEKYLLYFDDTGSRDPDKNVYISQNKGRDDKMDCFGLGGILVKEEDVDEILQKHKAFCSEWGIDYPLHSYSIRGGHGKFGWLKKPERAGVFFPALEDFLLDLPIICTACVIDRPGYVARYKDSYDERLWFMCKTAFCVLIERAAKFADDQGAKLEIFFEETGKAEDRAFIRYMRELKSTGNPFSAQTSGIYKPFCAEDYKRVILGEPRRKKKTMPMVQLADLVLYPMAKGGYDADYPPYKKLKEARKLIDCMLEENDIPLRGIKYSCFDTHKD